MLAAYERHLVVSYLANAATRLDHRDRVAGALVEWVSDGNDGAAQASRRLRARLARADVDPEENLSRAGWRSFRQALREECAAATRPRPDLTARRLRRLSEGYESHDGRWSLAASGPGASAAEETASPEAAQPSGPSEDEGKGTLGLNL